ncbi:hypothetical protein [Streptomyces niveus]|uniref:hypothetical protein n=1 Tax=Streptomyces niveus TaxID=193462 RepID=UPI0034030988
MASDEPALLEDAWLHVASVVMSPAGAQTRLDADAIAGKYRVTGRTARAWTQAEGFPGPNGRGTYAAAAVDNWVRSNRPRSWAAAQQPAAKSKPAKAAARRPADGTKRPRTATPVVLDTAGIATRFNVPEPTVANWIAVKEKTEGGKVLRKPFPTPVTRRPRREWDQTQVDAWVEVHRPHVWAAFAGTGPVLVKPLPAGDPRDLLDIDDFGEILGNATRGTPVAHDTMVAYHNRGQIPFADRKPDDGGKPRVFAYHWYRQTVNDHILQRTGPGRFGPR